MFTLEDIIKLNDEEINTYEYEVKRTMQYVQRYYKENQIRKDKINSGNFKQYLIDSMTVAISNYEKKIQIRLDRINEIYKPIYTCDYCGTIINKENKFLLNVCNKCMPEYKIDREKIRRENDLSLCNEDCFNCKYDDCKMPDNQ